MAPENERRRKSEGRRSKDVARASEASADACPTLSAEEQALLEEEQAQERQERQVKLADLRERKAKLLEAKDRQFALAVQQREAEHKLAMDENYANLEHGKARGLRGCDLVEHAAQLAAEKGREKVAAAKEFQEASKADIISSHSEESQAEARKTGTDSHSQEENKEDARVDSQEGSKADANVQSQEGSKVHQEEDGVDGTGSEDQMEAVDLPDIDPLSYSFLHRNKARSQIGRTQEQDEEAERLKHQAEFIANRTVKTKNINRKGHHAAGRLNSKLCKPI